MNLIIILSACVVAHAAEYYNLPKDHYTPEQLKNDGAELKRRTDCYLDIQPCTPLTAEYKKIAQDMVTSGCDKCSSELKALTQGYLVGLKEHHPAVYRELILKYDSSVIKFNTLEKAVGMLQTIFSSLPSLQSIPSITSLPSLQSIQSLPSLPSLPSLQKVPFLSLSQSKPSSS